MSAILLDQEIVHYEVLGRGRPLVFLHGWVGSWRYWIPAMQAASISCRAYALDFFGFGDSAKNQRYSLQQQAGLLDSFLMEMGIGKVALVGHGLGAMVALYYAFQNPSVVDRVMAVSYPMEDTSLNARLKTGTPQELAGWLLNKLPQNEPVLGDAPKTDPLAMRASMNGTGRAAVAELWAHLTTSSLLVYGQGDPAVAPPRLEENPELPQQTHSIVFDNSGHFPMLDETSKFNRLLIDFLSLPSGESPRTLQLKEEWKRRMR